MKSRPTKTQRWILLGLAMPLLLALLWVAAGRSYSGILDYFVERALTQWETQQKPPTLDQVLRTYDLFEDAVAQTPNDPRLLARGARLHEWLAWHAKDQREAYLQSMQGALTLYRRSLQERPGWPYTWLDFAAAKGKAEELDEEFNGALRNALTLGPWETAIQTGAANLGLANWRRLDDENRRLLEQNIANALAVQERELFSSVEKANNLLLLCFAFQQNPDIANHCETKHIY